MDNLFNILSKFRRQKWKILRGMKEFDAQYRNYCADAKDAELRAILFCCAHDAQICDFLQDRQYAPTRQTNKINTTIKFAAVTYFERPDARLAFPCWNTPATIDLTVTGPKDRVILSNMPEIYSKEVVDTTTVTFDTTPVMPTYEVAVLVGELDYVEGSTPRRRGTRSRCTLRSGRRSRNCLLWSVK